MKKQTKKLLCAVLAVLMALSLCACAGNSPASSSGAQSSETLSRFALISSPSYNGLTDSVVDDISLTFCLEYNPRDRHMSKLDRIDASRYTTVEPEFNSA